jgi:hypothetical protein
MVEEMGEIMRRPAYAQILNGGPLEDLQKGMELALGGGPVMKVLIDPTAT